MTMTNESPQAPLTDVAVLILFFNRPDRLKQVFDAVRRARPSRLFLYQDGPRSEADMPALEACRKVVAEVDWQCDVRRNYCTENHGCDPSEYYAQRWAFSMAEQCVVLEDDDIPSDDFIPFCKAMLDRYADDERIGMIAGFNHEEHTTDIGDDSYFFTTNCSIWGWASWRRAFERWEPDYAFLRRPESVARLEAIIRERRLRKDFLATCRAHAATGIEYYETLIQAALLLNGQMSIVPRHNMISNIGVTDESTHYAGSIATTPRGLRRIFTMGRHNLDRPLRHPADVIDHVAFRRRVYRIMAWGHPWVKAARSVEELWLNLRHGDMGRITSALSNRLRIIFGGRKYH